MHAIFRETIQEVISKVLEGFATLIFSTVYIHGINTEEKTKLVKEGLDTIWKETLEENSGNGWTQVRRKRNKRRQSTESHEEDQQTEPEQEMEYESDIDGNTQNKELRKKKILSWLCGEGSELPPRELAGITGNSEETEGKWNPHKGRNGWRRKK